MEIGKFVMAHLEYFVGGIGIPAAIFIIPKLKNFKGKENNLTRFYLEQNRRTAVLNKKNKSTLF